jgi:hypothetical protein
MGWSAEVTCVFADGSQQGVDEQNRASFVMRRGKCEDSGMESLTRAGQSLQDSPLSEGYFTSKTALGKRTILISLDPLLNVPGGAPMLWRNLRRIIEMQFVNGVMLLLWITVNIALAQQTSVSPKLQSEPRDEAETVFSGPQVGEKLPRFMAHGVFDRQAGKEIDHVQIAAGRPIVLIFVHDVNRQSISLARILSTYTHSRAKDGLVSAMVLLHDDPTEAETMLKRMRHAVGPVDASIAAAANANDNVPSATVDYATVVISKDGREGPGSYGLNRNVTLTILVANDNIVTANYALVQPSLQVDLPKILESVVAAVGGTVPKLEELEGMPKAMDRPEGSGEAPNMRPLLGPLIRRDATDDQVAAAAAKVEEAAAKDKAIRNEVGRIANTIINAGKLEDYGTPKCREFLTKWAKEFGDPAKPDSTEAKPGRKR